jgi:hypothetical protein
MTMIARYKHVKDWTTVLALAAAGGGGNLASHLRRDMDSSSRKDEESACKRQPAASPTRSIRDLYNDAYSF